MNSESSQPDTARTGSKVRVMLVDDQLIVAEAFRRTVEKVPDVAMHYCDDPEQAIDAARQFGPTVILQDLVMPAMDGLTLLSLFKSNPITRDVPVIVLSTKMDPKIKSRALGIGASDYLVKFPDELELLARLRLHSTTFVVQRQRDNALRELQETKAELERRNAELEALSCRDGLTGVLNRRGFDDYLSKEWHRAMREKSAVGLLLIDIDYFKAYNDNYGHQGGDACLQKVARALGMALKRPTDVVARYGGEEFAVILPDTGVDGAERIAEALRVQVESLALQHDHSKVADHVTISAGVTSFMPDPNQTPDELIRLADAALYEAKRTGRNRFACRLPDSEQHKL